MSDSNIFECSELMPANAEEAIEQCVMANRILANEGILTNYGHVSVRNPNNPQTFFQSVSMPGEYVTRKDMLEIGLDGTIYTDTSSRPFREFLTLAEIYKARPDVNAVCHTHLHELIAFSVSQIPIRPMSQPSGMFYDGVPVYGINKSETGFLAESPAENQQLIEALGSHRALLIKHHGAFIVGECCINMVVGATSLRDNVVIQMQAMALGEYQYLSREEALAVCTNTLSPQKSKSMWEYWVKRAQRVMPDLYW